MKTHATTPGRRGLAFFLSLVSLAALLVAGSSSLVLAKAAPSPDGVVNLNTATAEQLCWLPGIGSGKAERIVAHRADQPFKKVVELARVKGIGLKTVRQLKTYLAVTGPTTLNGPIASPRPKASAKRRE